MIDDNITCKAGILTRSKLINSLILISHKNVSTLLMIAFTNRVYVLAHYTVHNSSVAQHRTAKSECLQLATEEKTILPKYSCRVEGYLAFGSLANLNRSVTVTFVFMDNICKR